MEQNPLQLAVDKRILSLGPQSYINLIDSNFLDNGFMFPQTILAEGFSQWLNQRQYHPNAKGDPAARQAIADFYNRGGPVSQVPPNSPPISGDNILLTASSSESYNLLFQTLCQPGDNVLLPKPGYPLFEDLATANNLECRYYSLLEQLDWQMDPAAIEALIDQQTRFLVLISPNNPCGTVLTAETISQLGKICRERQIMVICDEVFSEFLFGSAFLPRPCHIMSGIPVFTINGISKIFALPDLKLSWITLSGDFSACTKYPDQTELLHLLEFRNDTFLSCNSLSQFLLPRLMAQGTSFTQSMVETIASNLKTLNSLSGSKKSYLRFVRPTSGIHCVLLVSKYAFPNDEELAIDILQELAIYTHPGYLYGITDDTALIISLLKNPELFTQSIVKLASYFAES